MKKDVTADYSHASNWLFPQVARLAPDDDEIIAARKNIYNILTHPHKTKPMGLAFSGGKDSLLLALLTHEVCQQHGLPQPPLISSLTGYEKNQGREMCTIIDAVSSKFDVRVYRPSLLFNYSVIVLGVGVQPLNSHRFRDCQRMWKQGSTPRMCLLTGVRCDESKNRKTVYKNTPRDTIVMQDTHQWRATPLLDVSTATCWDYLRRHVDAIGVDYGFLRAWYDVAGSGRDGCWCCHFATPSEGTPFEQDIRRLARYWGKWYLDNRQHMNHEPHFPGRRRPRATLKYKRIIYQQVLELEQKHGVKYITPKHDALIREIWNWQAPRLTMGDDCEDDPYNHLSQKLWLKDEADYMAHEAINPQLIRSLFEPKTRGQGMKYKMVNLAFEYKDGQKIICEN